MNGLKSLRRLNLSIEHLEKQFTGWRVKNISTDHIKKYIVERKEQKASINNLGTVSIIMCEFKKVMSVKPNQSMVYEYGLRRPSNSKDVPSIGCDVLYFK